MVSEKTADVARRAKQLYEEKLRMELEATNMNDFVAIEPDSGDYFVADTFSHAVAKSRSAHLDRISFVIRIGHKAAIHIGGMQH